MQGGSENVWQWSEEFLEVMEGSKRDQQRHDERLRGLRWQILAGRELYWRGHGEPLRVLRNYWRTVVGDDVREQVRFALRDLGTSRRLFVSAIGALCVREGAGGKRGSKR